MSKASDMAFRVERAAEALIVGTDNDTPETDVTDLLANLMHYCDQEGLCFDDLLKIASIHYEEEK